MPSLKSQNYKKALSLLCNNERDLIDLVASAIYAQHAKEVFLVQKTIEKEKDDAEGLWKKFTKELKTDIIGTTQMIFVFMEIYRFMVDNGDIEPVDALSITHRLGINPEGIEEMLKLSRQSLKKDKMLAGTLDHELMTFDGMSEVDIDEEEAKVAETVEGILKDAFDDAIKGAKKKGDKDVK